MYGRILLPVDGSPHSRRAVEAAVALAQQSEAAVFLLHVIRDLSLPREILDMVAAGEVTASRMEILQDSAEIILSNARKEFDKAGIKNLQSAYDIGDPVKTILKHAAQNEVDLIVIGHRGLGPNERLLGGVARKLLNMTTVSCLVVV